MKSKKRAVVLALTLGIFGVHRFYLGQKGLGIIYLMLPFTGLIDGLMFGIYRGLGSRESFDSKYNSQSIQREILEALKNK